MSKDSRLYCYMELVSKQLKCMAQMYDVFEIDKEEVDKHRKDYGDYSLNEMRKSIEKDINKLLTIINKD